MAGYHSKDITRGIFGEISKITEEHEELLDAVQQGNRIMVLCELSDMVGAIEAYAKKYHNINLSDILVMKDATRRAFEDGTRSPRTRLDTPETPEEYGLINWPYPTTQSALQDMKKQSTDTRPNWLKDIIHNFWNH